MRELIIYYLIESSYLKLLVISLLPILMAPLLVLLAARSIFQWFDPSLKMTPTKLFIFVALAVILSLILMGALLFYLMPPGTDYRLPLIATLIIFGLLGTGRLHLVDRENR